jgi:hypothetical protein
MKLFCSFCNLECKSTGGLTRHTREKHNLLTQNKFGLSDFPVRRDFEEFTMVHDDSNFPSSLLTNYKRPSSSRAPDKQVKRSRLASDLEFSGPKPDEIAHELEVVHELDETEDITTMADYILHEPNGGQILDSDEARLRHNNILSRFQWVPESDVNNPLHPWKHKGEIWLTDLLFRNGNVSQTTANTLLDAFANGRISMTDGPIQFTNSREMMTLLDVAARQGIVCSRKFLCILLCIAAKRVAYIFICLAFSKQSFHHPAHVRDLDWPTDYVLSQSPCCYTKINVESFVQGQNGI